MLSESDILEPGFISETSAILVLSDVTGCPWLSNSLKISGLLIDCPL